MKIKNILVAQTTNKEVALLLFRIFVAFSIMRTHGIPKLMAFKETEAHIPDPLGFGTTFSAYYAVFANVFCAILVAFGFATRLAALLIISLTLSGLLLIHFNDPAKVQDVPLIYSIVFGFIAYVGAGKYSLDNKIFNRQFH
ncbi:DoxX family protein [Olivibacter domesticus]|uniref:Putative oxidoreductase n=1 Tax=Olivibacter domesticus TaxID=407022 RepID=A0A1H7WLH1_OLID1|nr:DoxX family protein [Olivibacter domesticus]SEM22492.1 putative oxidoreductase [Olivibacter domesticus]